MKNVVTMVVCAILGILSLVIVMSISGRSNRSMELKRNLSSVVEETVEEMLQSEQYSIENTNQFIGDMVEKLSVAIDSDSEIRVNIVQIDKEKGILAAKVTEEFKYPNGNPGSVETEKTVLLNGIGGASEPEQYEVCFYFSKEDMNGGKICYKRYLVDAGKSVTAPKNPFAEEKVFACWKDSNDYLADFSVPVEQNQTYYAVWN